MITEDNDTGKETKPKRFRLVVRSAEEAVRMIRDKLGENARVVSVRQTGGEGLKRFISSPKLEVIAEVPLPDETSTVQAPEVSIPADLSGGDSAEFAVESQTSSANQIDQSKDSGETKPTIESNSEQVDALNILTKAGFDETLISQMKSWPEVGKLDGLSLADVLPKSDPMSVGPLSINAFLGLK